MWRMTWLVRAACVAGLTWFGPLACGDDDGGGGSTADDADSGTLDGGGGSGATGGSGGSGGSGGTGGTGGSGGVDAGQVTKAQCLEAQASTTAVSMACLDCACDAVPDATAMCNADCWSLLTCLHLECDGKLDDLDCANAECGEWVDLASVSEAIVMLLTGAIGQCSDDCVFEDDAGVDQDGGN